MSLANVSPVEARIARDLVEDIVNGGFEVVINNGEDETVKLDDVESILAELAHTYSDTLDLYDDGILVGYVWLIWGNGEDLISDYYVTPVMENLLITG